MGEVSDRGFQGDEVLDQASLWDLKAVVVYKESCSGGRSVISMKTQLGHRREEQDERRTIAAAYGIYKAG